MGRLQDLDAAIREAGIPIWGVAIRGEESAPYYVAVDYRDEATATDRTRGDNIASHWDWTPIPAIESARMTAIETIDSAEPSWQACRACFKVMLDWMNELHAEVKRLGGRVPAPRAYEQLAQTVKEVIYTGQADPPKKPTK